MQHGWNYPGDAYARTPTGYFRYVARTDDMIVSAGYNISGPEVEQALLTPSDVKEVAVVAKPDPEQDTNIVKAYRRAYRRQRAERCERPTSCVRTAKG